MSRGKFITPEKKDEKPCSKLALGAINCSSDQRNREETSRTERVAYNREKINGDAGSYPESRNLAYPLFHPLFTLCPFGERSFSLSSPRLSPFPISLFPSRFADPDIHYCFSQFHSAALWKNVLCRAF